jgi:hypothetical protein
MPELLSHPKVGQISLKVAVQQNIATFDVTMYNGYIKVTVQVRESLSYVFHNGSSFRPVKVLGKLFLLQIGC